MRSGSKNSMCDMYRAKWCMCQVIYQKRVLCASSRVPNTEKQMKARGRKPSAFIVSRCLEPLMKHEARVSGITAQMKQYRFIQCHIFGIILFNSWDMHNRPFAGSSHMVQNKLHWNANDAVGLPKQRNSYQSSSTFFCIESPTASFASQCNLFRAYLQEQMSYNHF